MKSETLTQLHAPLIPILRHVLALAPLPRAGRALDLACGPGLKAALLAEALGPGVRLLGVDSDPTAIHTMTAEPRTENGHPQGQPRTENRERAPAGSTENREPTNQEPRTKNREQKDNTPAHPLTRSPAHWDGRQSSVVGLVGDALALPMRDGCCDAAFCIAALGLFADQRVALRELRRALRPGGLALLVVGTQAWAQVVRWPGDLAARLAAAYAQALADGAAPVPAAPDLGGELVELLAGAGFDAPLFRAFWIDHAEPRTKNGHPQGQPRTACPLGEQRTTNNEQRAHELETADCRLPTADLQQTTDHRPRTTDSSLESELPLLPWPVLRMLLAGRLPTSDLARCDALATAPDIELCALALVALAPAT